MKLSLKTCVGDDDDKSCLAEEECKHKRTFKRYKLDWSNHQVDC